MYLYETHAHTSEVSRCGKIEGRDLARFYHHIGFSGLCVTDHFFNGNTWIDEDLSWAEKVRLLSSGYQITKEEGDKLGLEVFFGWEYSLSGTDFLTYGLDEAFLLSHPELLSLPINDYCDLVHESGGFIVHAHPFREADYIDMIRLLPRKVDAVETYNACRTDFENAAADWYADYYDLKKMAGSDNHVGPLERLGCMGSSRPIESIQDLIRMIQNGQGALLSLPGLD